MNHRIDAIADLVIFRTRAGGLWDPDQMLCSAFFDVHWKPDVKLTWFAP